MRKVLSQLHGSGLAYREQRHLFIPLVARRALGARIERRHAIDQKQVVMVTVVQRHLDHPRAGCRFIGWTEGSHSLKSPTRETFLALGAEQMKLIGLAIFLAE